MGNGNNVFSAQDGTEIVLLKNGISSYSFHVTLIYTNIIAENHNESIRYQAIDSFFIGHLFYIDDKLRHGGGQQ